MTIQATPPLPDPISGRIPPYTQVLEYDDASNTWIIKYDVVDTPTVSTTGTAVTSVQQGQQTTTDPDDGLTTPITEFPDPVGGDGGQDDTIPDPQIPDIDPTPVTFLDDRGGGEGMDRGKVGPGAINFGGGWFDGDTGEPLGDFATGVMNTITGQNELGEMSVIANALGAISKANTPSAMAMMSDEARSKVFNSAIGQKALSDMSVSERSKLKKSIQKTMQRRNMGLNVGFDVHPDYAFDESRPTMRDVAGEVGLRDSNFGSDTTAPGADASTIGGTGGRRGGAGTGTGASTTDRTSGGSVSGGPPGTGAESDRGIGGQTPGPRGERGGRGDGGGSSPSGGGGPAGCFVEGTAVQMADGTTKEITNIEIGEETRGGIVQAKMEFMPQNIYNYKGVLVSGSHWVVEDNQFIEVEDSKYGVLTDRVEPVYTFKTSNNRIWIDDIEFGDFETGSDEDWAPYFEKVKQDLNKKLRGEA